MTCSVLRGTRSLMTASGQGSGPRAPKSSQHKIRELSMLDQVLSIARVDFSPPHRTPLAVRVLLVTFACTVGSCRRR